MSRIPVFRPVAAALLSVSLLTASGAHAQQRPLTTEDPETIGAGRFLFEGGVESGQDARYPLSGLRGDRLAMPLGVSFGLGSIGELQLDAGYTWFGIDNRVEAPLAFRVPADVTRTHDLIDLVIATKIRLLSEGARRPSDRDALRDATAKRQQRERPRSRYHRFYVQPAGRQDGRDPSG